MASKFGSWQFAPGTSALRVKLPGSTALAPNTTTFDGSQGMYVNAGANFWQDLNAIYEVGLEYVLEVHVGRPPAVFPFWLLQLGFGSPETEST